ncbi:VWA domain-containing protein [Tropicimonas sp. TH_r6]|uniref:vWA domain-containing protein n=1 Tax=Tropicimonas sp. TH_r6 TaxID=3082085 RepID=UPI002952CD2F|nr:VWA domain-containing protein [Tropicimonas sp. TH_r6]MDV7144137.1 VWA domain-containing protein [Tropicimonas sp. TH_r6]
MKPIYFRLGLLALLSLSLAACKEDAPEPDAQSAPEVQRAPPPTVSVAVLGATQWPSDEIVAQVGEIETAADPFAENNMLVLDMSGSMEARECSGDDHSSRAEAAKTAVLTWLSANPGDNVGLVTFSADGTKLDFPLGQGSAHAEAIVNRIQSLQPKGGTPLLLAMNMGYEELAKQAVRQGGTGSYRLIVITDGEASKGHDPRDLVSRIASNPADMVELHTIGFCISGKHSLKDTDRVFYTDANSPADLKAGLDATQGETASFDAGNTTFEELQQ